MRILEKACIMAGFAFFMMGLQPLAWAVEKPDLTIKNIKIEPAEPVTGDTTTFTAQVWNIGTVTAASFKSSIKIGGETTPMIIGPMGVAPNIFGFITRQLKMDRPGTYKVTFSADVEKVVNESNESNNEGSLAFTIRPRKPDLTLKDPKIEPANPTTKDNIRFIASLVNIGLAPAPPSKNGIRVGGETKPKLGSYGIIPVDSPTTTKYVVARVMKITKPGNYIVTFIADANNDVDELNEGNNQIQLQFTVK
jgi:subtilase family serine protease